jgi:hypothetical protein
MSSKYIPQDSGDSGQRAGHAGRNIPQVSEQDPVTCQVTPPGGTDQW